MIILPKSTEFASMVAAYSTYEICVTEIWLDDSILDCEFTLPNCVVVRCNGACGRVGGVALFLGRVLVFLSFLGDYQALSHSGAKFISINLFSLWPFTELPVLPLRLFFIFTITH